MTQSKTVLVTGATGFIGSATVAILEQAGWKVTKGSRSASQSMRSGFIFLDLANPATILALAKGPCFDAIVHLGAHIGLSEDAESAMFSPNTLSTGCLAYLADIWSAYMVYASTAIVHGVGNEAIDSKSPVCADTAYAKSKWLGEQLLAASNARHCILRIAGVFGHDGPAHLGLNRAIAGAIKGVPPSQIGLGAALRNYIYVKDVAQAVNYALQERLAGIHLLAGHEVMTVSAMLQKVCVILAPGLHPLSNDGAEAMNQVIKPSDYLPKTRRFCEALLDIRKESRQ